jgi:hypothetical protein
LYSRRLLVAWVCYCLSHAAAASAHPLVLQYDVCLDYHNLQYLMLHDRPSTDALLRVAAYLRQHQGSTPPAACWAATSAGGPLFSLRDQGVATWAFARQYAAADATLQALLDAHVLAARVRQDAHWAEVLRIKAKVRSVRARLAAAKQKLQHAQDAEAAARSSFEACPVPCLYSISNYWETTSRRDRLREVLSQCEAVTASARQQVQDLEKSLAAALQSPHPVLQPLPEDKGLARCWLFFLYMPPLLRYGLERMATCLHCAWQEGGQRCQAVCVHTHIARKAP